MNNELRILPLRSMKLLIIVVNHQHDLWKLTCLQQTITVIEGRMTRFYRNGNVIREYQMPLMRIVVTPADDEAKAA
jgi:hypothetical protein